ncbi:hypothetical protein KIPB_010773, partial [Kipferlia bialata]|eukprot:g10773.t1
MPFQLQIGHLGAMFFAADRRDATVSHAIRRARLEERNRDHYAGVVQEHNHGLSRAKFESNNNPHERAAVARELKRLELISEHMQMKREQIRGMLDGQLAAFREYVQASAPTKQQMLEASMAK